MTEPRPEVTCTENFVKFGLVFFETGERTDKRDRQTDRHADSNTAHTYRQQLSDYHLFEYRLRYDTRQ